MDLLIVLGSIGAGFASAAADVSPSARRILFIGKLSSGHGVRRGNQSHPAGLKPHRKYVLEALSGFKVENFDLTPRALTRRVGFEGEFSFCVAFIR
jgi:hypothetical protein